MRGPEHQAVCVCRTRKGNTGWQARASLAAVLVAALSASGCSALSAKPAAPPVKVTLSLDAERYQIGEPVWATVKVENDSRRPLVLSALDDSTLTFYWGQPATAERRRRWPVLPKGLAAEPREVPPGQSAERRLLFAVLTQQTGRWGMMAALAGCISSNRQVQAGEPYYSPPVWYEVSEQVKFRRDPYSGIITSEQAIELARAYSGSDGAAKARAVLVPVGESGLVTWAVFLEPAEGSPGEAQALEVNPYSGTLRPLSTAQVPPQPPQ